MSETHTHSAGQTETAQPVRASVLQTEPVALAMAASILSQATAAGVLLAKRQTVPAILVLAATLVTAAAAIRARSLVTPMSRPRDLDADPLTPISAEPDEKTPRA